MATRCGNKVWQQGMATWYGNKVWQQGMATWYGNKVWQQGMATRYGNKVWQQGMATWYVQQQLQQVKAFYGNLKKRTYRPHPLPPGNKVWQRVNVEYEYSREIFPPHMVQDTEAQVGVGDNEEQLSGYTNMYVCSTNAGIGWATWLSNRGTTSLFVLQQILTITIAGSAGSYPLTRVAIEKLSIITMKTQRTRQ